MANEKAAVNIPAKKSEKNDKKPAPKGEKKSIVKYFKDARSEFKKVVWPSKKQVFNNTVVVIISLVVSGIAIGAIDSVFMFLIKLMLGK